MTSCKPVSCSGRTLHHGVSITHADPQIFVKMAGVPDLPATTLTDMCRGTACVDTKGIQLRMVFRAMTSVRLERETNHDLPQRTYVHSTIQYVSVNMGRRALRAWLVRLLQSQYSIHMKQTQELTRKKIRNRLYYRRGEPYNTSIK